MQSLLDRIHMLQSRLEQRGTVWDDDRSSDLKRRVQLLKGLLARKVAERGNTAEIERSIHECEENWEELMNMSDPSEERNELTAGQHAWKRLGDIESRFKNLEETVAPHMRDWWEENLSDWKKDVEEARAMLSGSSAEPGPLSDEQFRRVSDVLDRLEQKEKIAAEELGSRTAAGRAKAG